MPDTSDNKKKMLEALEATAGIVTEACQRVGISRDTHYRWKREDLSYKKAVEDIDEVALDLAESKLIEQIREGNITAIIFYLKTKGKYRGYVERMDEELYLQQQTRKKEEEEQEFDYSKLTVDELNELDRLLLKAAPSENGMIESSPA